MRFLTTGSAGVCQVSLVSLSPSQGCEPSAFIPEFSPETRRWKGEEMAKNPNQRQSLCPVNCCLPQIKFSSPYCALQLSLFLDLSITKKNYASKILIKFGRSLGKESPKELLRPGGAQCREGPPPECTGGLKPRAAAPRGPVPTSQGTTAHTGSSRVRYNMDSNTHQKPEKCTKPSAKQSSF